MVDGAAYKSVAGCGATTWTLIWGTAKAPSYKYTTAFQMPPRTTLDPDSVAPWTLIRNRARAQFQVHHRVMRCPLLCTRRAIPDTHCERCELSETVFC